MSKEKLPQTRFEQVDKRLAASRTFLDRLDRTKEAIQEKNETDDASLTNLTGEKLDQAIPQAAERIIGRNSRLENAITTISQLSTDLEKERDTIAAKAGTAQKNMELALRTGMPTLIQRAEERFREVSGTPLVPTQEAVQEARRKALDARNAKIQASPSEENVIKPGDPFPEFSLQKNEQTGRYMIELPGGKVVSTRGMQLAVGLWAVLEATKTGGVIRSDMLEQVVKKYVPDTQTRISILVSNINLTLPGYDDAIDSSVAGYRIVNKTKGGKDIKGLYRIERYRREGENITYEPTSPTHRPLEQIDTPSLEDTLIPPTVSDVTKRKREAHQVHTVTLPNGKSIQVKGRITAEYLKVILPHNDQNPISSADLSAMLYGSDTHKTRRRVSWTKSEVNRVLEPYGYIIRQPIDIVERSKGQLAHYYVEEVQKDTSEERVPLTLESLAVVEETQGTTLQQIEEIRRLVAEGSLPESVLLQAQQIAGITDEEKSPIQKNPPVAESDETEIILAEGEEVSVIDLERDYMDESFFDVEVGPQQMVTDEAPAFHIEYEIPKDEQLTGPERAVMHALSKYLLHTLIPYGTLQDEIQRDLAKLEGNTVLPGGFRKEIYDAKTLSALFCSSYLKMQKDVDIPLRREKWTEDDTKSWERVQKVKEQEEERRKRKNVQRKFTINGFFKKISKRIEAASNEYYNLNN